MIESYDSYLFEWRPSEGQMLHCPCIVFSFQKNKSYLLSDYRRAIYWLKGLTNQFKDLDLNNTVKWCKWNWIERHTQNSKQHDSGIVQIVFEGSVYVVHVANTAHAHF